MAPKKGPIALAAALTTYFLGRSWLYVPPLFVLYFFIWGACDVLIYRRYFHPLRALPGPKGHWLLGEFRAILNEEPGQAHIRWMREYRNPTGLISYPGLFYHRRLMPTSTSAIQHILNNWTVYTKPEQSRRALSVILGNGLLVAEGETHRRQKKVLTPAFAVGYIREIVPIFWEKATDLVNKLETMGQPPEGIDVFRQLCLATLDIIGSAGFGYEFNSLHNPDDPFAKAYAEIFDERSRVLSIVANYIPIMTKLPFRRNLQVLRARKSIAKHTTKLVRDKESVNAIGKDILSLMIQENRKAAEEGKLAEMEMVDQVMTFMLAGHETTSTALCWTLWTLAQHQDVQSRLREEVKHLVNPTFEQIEACRYLNNVCREMLRYIPPVSITTRVAQKDDHINGVYVPKGTMVFIVVSAANFDETVWGPDIDSFNPDRWEKLPETVSNYSYLTFLQGPRSCIGRKFAETEMKVLLVALIQRLQFDEVVKGRKVEKKAVITTRPKDGMYLKISPVY